jgi:hypothetical protein
MTVLLLNLGRQRFELYSEPPEDEVVAPAPDAGWWRRWAHRASERWHELVEMARRGQSDGWFARQRNRVVCQLAETIAATRTLRALASTEGATLLYATSMSEADARRELDRELQRARRHHGWWSLIDGTLFLASAILAPIPGPNAVAYYLAFRVVGHGQSWLGARRALTRVQWAFQPDQTMTELASLVALSRDARRSRLDAIAAQLNLRRLTAFFERVAA